MYVAYMQQICDLYAIFSTGCNAFNDGSFRKVIIVHFILTQRKYLYWLIVSSLNEIVAMLTKESLTFLIGLINMET